MTDNKGVTFGTEAKQKILTGVQVLADAVKTTLGPKGRNVILDQGLRRPPIITKDGITVAKSIQLEDRQEELGIQLLREATARTGDEAGDGTTTATVLAEAIYTQGLHLLTLGADPMALKRGLDRGTSAVVSLINDMSISLDTAEQIYQVATIAANGEQEVGNTLSEAFAQVGKDGVVVVEQGGTQSVELQLIEGMEYDAGYLSPGFVTNNRKGQAIFDDGLYVLVSDRFTSPVDLVKPLEAALNDKKPILLVVPDLSDDALHTLVVNRLQNGIPMVAVGAPGYGEMQKDNLRDIAIATGATSISEETGITYDTFEKAHLGYARKVVVDKISTIIISGGGDRTSIEEHAQLLRSEMNQPTLTEQERFRLQARVARLTSGVARIKVGGATPAEISERRDRVEDAICATRAAIEQGIVAGGGVALLNAKQQLNLKTTSEDEELGIKLLVGALEAPLRQIVANAGMSPELVLATIKQKGLGYNAATDTYEDLLETGVIDPVKVVILALQNAVSAAGTMLTTECMVFKKDD